MVQDWTRDSLPRHQTFQPQYYSADATRHQSFSSERYTSDVVQRHHPFPQERVGVEADNSRFQDGNDSRRHLMVSLQDIPASLLLTPVLTMHEKQSIDDALRTHCGIVAKHYFVTAITDEGATMTFVNPTTGRGMSDNTIRQFFDATKYRQVMARIDSGWCSIMYNIKIFSFLVDC